MNNDDIKEILKIEIYCSLFNKRIINIKENFRS